MFPPIFQAGYGNSFTSFRSISFDDLNPYLKAIKTCDGAIFGTPIYMYHVTGQMKTFIDRCYSLYSSRPDGSGYDSAVPAGKTFALVTSQGHPDVERFQRPIRWFAAMTGTGLGMEEVGRIIQGDTIKSLP